MFLSDCLSSSNSCRKRRSVHSNLAACIDATSTYARWQTHPKNTLLSGSFHLYWFPPKSKVFRCACLFSTVYLLSTTKMNLRRNPNQSFAGAQSIVLLCTKPALNTYLPLKSELIENYLPSPFSGTAWSDSKLGPSLRGFRGRGWNAWPNSTKHCSNERTYYLQDMWPWFVEQRVTVYFILFSNFGQLTLKAAFGLSRFYLTNVKFQFTSLIDNRLMLQTRIFGYFVMVPSEMW